MLGTFFTPLTLKETASKQFWHALRHVRDARAVMHVGIGKPRWREKRSRQFRRMRYPQITYLVRGPLDASEPSKYKIHPNACTHVTHSAILCCGLVPKQFTPVLHGYFTDTGAFIQCLQCQRSNFGGILVTWSHESTRKFYYINNKTGHNKCACIFRKCYTAQFWPFTRGDLSSEYNRQWLAPYHIQTGGDKCMFTWSNTDITAETHMKVNKTHY